MSQTKQRQTLLPTIYADSCFPAIELAVSGSKNIKVELAKDGQFDIYGKAREELCERAKFYGFIKRGKYRSKVDFLLCAIGDLLGKDYSKECMEYYSGNGEKFIDIYMIDTVNQTRAYLHRYLECAVILGRNNPTGSKGVKIQAVNNLFIKGGGSAMFINTKYPVCKECWNLLTEKNSSRSHFNLCDVHNEDIPEDEKRKG